MMIYAGFSKGPADRSVWFVRIASSVAMVAYPIGGLTLALGPDTGFNMAVGYGLILVSLMCVALLAGSSTQRIVAEEAKQLDEFELQLRHKAMATAYTVLSVLALATVIYAAIATDKGGWVPTTFDQFNGLFWGVFLYTSTLPTACLAWRLDPSAEEVL
jgi:hypothetical protein